VISFNVAIAKIMVTPKDNALILLDVLVVPTSIPLRSVHNQKILLQLVPYQKVATLQITVAVQSTKAYNVQSSNQT